MYHRYFNSHSCSKTLLQYETAKILSISSCRLLPRTTLKHSRQFVTASPLSPVQVTYGQSSIAGLVSYVLSCIAISVLYLELCFVSPALLRNGSPVSNRQGQSYIASSVLYRQPFYGTSILLRITKTSLISPSLPRNGSPVSNRKAVAYRQPRFRMAVMSLRIARSVSYRKTSLISHGQPHITRITLHRSFKVGSPVHSYIARLVSPACSSSLDLHPFLAMLRKKLQSKLEEEPMSWWWWWWWR